MTDPVTTTLAASVLVDLAFREFAKSSASELAKKFTSVAISKMEELRKLIWNKLKGNPDAKNALTNVIENRAEEDIADIATYLKAAMAKDVQFAAQVQNLGNEIRAGKIVDQSNMTQNNYDNARGWQTKVEGGTAYIGEIHVQNHPE